MALDKRILGASVVAILIGQPALADDHGQTDSIEEVEVRASKIHAPHSIGMHELDRQRLESMASSTSDTASMLGSVPGMSLYRAGGVSSLPVLHGLADDRLRIRVDGMDLVSACGNHMNPPLSYISPSSVVGVRVYAGIVPVSVGGDSIGGAVQVESARPEFASGEETLFKGEAGTFYRSNGNARGANIGLTVASRHFNLAYKGSTEKADNYSAGDAFKAAGPAAPGRDFLAGDEVGSTMYKSSNQSLSLAVHHDNHLLQLKLGVQDIPYQGWPNQRMDMTRNDSDQLNLRYDGQYGWGALEARLFHENTRHGMQFYDDKLFWYGPNNVPGSDGVPCTPSGGMNGCAAGMPMDTEGRNDGAALKADLSLGARDLLRLGVEAQQYTLDDWWEPSGKGMWPDVFWNINNGQRDRLGFFAEWEAGWSDRWMTQLGLRHETVEMDADEVQGYSPMYDPLSEAAFNAADRAKTDHNLDMTLLARATPSATSAYEFGISRKTRSPNLYERYSWSTHGMSMRMVNMAGDGNGYVGNIDLEPEVAHTVSVTADWHDADEVRWSVKLMPFYTRVEDYIDAERCSGAPSGVCTAANLAATEAFVYLRFVNQRARLYGVDLSGRLALADSPAYGAFSLSGVIAWLEGENETTGDNLYNIMPLNATFALEHRLGGWSSTAELELVSAKDDVSAVRNEIETSGYGLLHLRASYEWDSLRLDFGIENVFDRFYFDPLGGAYTGQGKTMSGNDVPWGVPVPGMGRSVYTGVNVKF
jgi:iron complex outermembrane recepter protein